MEGEDFKELESEVGDELHHDDPDLELEKKKKDLIDDDTVSLEDEAEEELEDEEEPFDDVDEM